MSSRRLYIIGNGFDLYHGMRTSYEDFRCYIRENCSDLSDIFLSYFNLDPDFTELWNKFEQNLGSFESGLFYDDYNNTEPHHENFKLSDISGFEDELWQESENVRDKIRDAFYRWLSEVEYSKSNYMQLTLDTNSKYLTFNYTDTLERLYGIPDKNILHLHNAIESSSGDLIFSHNIKIEEEPEFDEYGEHNHHPYSRAENASKLLLNEFYKDTTAIIEANFNFFNELKGINEIYVLGHSINDIDLPYFGHIMKIVGYNVKWIVSYYRDDECEEMNNKLKSVGVIGKITFIKMESLVLF